MEMNFSKSRDIVKATVARKPEIELNEPISGCACVCRVPEPDCAFR